MLVHILKHFASYSLLNSAIIERAVEKQIDYEAKNNKKSKGLQVLIVRHGSDEHNLRALKKSRGSI